MWTLSFRTVHNLSFSLTLFVKATVVHLYLYVYNSIDNKLNKAFQTIFFSIWDLPFHDRKRSKAFWIIFSFFLRIQFKALQIYFFVTEYSLKHSNNSQLKRLVREVDTNVEASIVLVMKVKDIKPEIHAQ